MDANIAINWLNNNEMMANPKKFQLMFLARNKSIEKEMSFVGKAIKSSSTVELLGITLDKNLNFKSHIENVCCKANNKIQRKAIGFKSLRLSCSDITQVNRKMRNVNYC